MTAACHCFEIFSFQGGGGGGFGGPLNGGD